MGKNEIFSHNFGEDNKAIDFSDLEYVSTMLNVENKFGDNI